MYSVVLMAALTTSSSTPDWGHHSCPCSGPSLGHGYAGIGQSCRGWLGHGGLYHGACAGGYYGACAGGYYGASYGGGGSWGCYGSASPYAAWPVGCTGSYGCTGCYGCYGGYSGYGVPLLPGVNYPGPNMGSPVPSAPLPPPIEVTPTPRLNKPQEQTRAKVRIEIPADAKLFVDGMLMKTSSAVRLFQTPVLSPNQTYYYELKAELTRNNQTYTDMQQIVVRPGEQASASFAGLEQRAAAVTQSTPATAQR